MVSIVDEYNRIFVNGYYVGDTEQRVDLMKLSPCGRFVGVIAGECLHIYETRECKREKGGKGYEKKERIKVYYQVSSFEWDDRGKYVCVLTEIGLYSIIYALRIYRLSDWKKVFYGCSHGSTISRIHPNEYRIGNYKCFVDNQSSRVIDVREYIGGQFPSYFGRYTFSCGTVNQGDREVTHLPDYAVSRIGNRNLVVKWNVGETKFAYVACNDLWVWDVKDLVRMWKEYRFLLLTQGSSNGMENKYFVIPEQKIDNVEEFDWRNDDLYYIQNGKVFKNKNKSKSTNHSRVYRLACKYDIKQYIRQMFLLALESGWDS